ncbi:unnamed protein product [Amoebophrya sp. A25]|nr:unnamed protein product [Amoebophrya sp. A25]|eukprot:GSA25T00024636001.1
MDASWMKKTGLGGAELASGKRNNRERRGTCGEKAKLIVHDGGDGEKVTVYEPTSASDVAGSDQDRAQVDESTVFALAEEGTKNRLTRTRSTLTVSDDYTDSDNDFFSDGDDETDEARSDFDSADVVRSGHQVMDWREASTGPFRTAMHTSSDEHEGGSCGARYAWVYAYLLLVGCGLLASFGLFYNQYKSLFLATPTRSSTSSSTSSHGTSHGPKHEIKHIPPPVPDPRRVVESDGLSTSSSSSRPAYPVLHSEAATTAEKRKFMAKRGPDRAGEVLSSVKTTVQEEELPVTVAGSGVHEQLGKNEKGTRQNYGRMKWNTAGVGSVVGAKHEAAATTLLELQAGAHADAAWPPAEFWPHAQEYIRAEITTTEMDKKKHPLYEQLFRAQGKTGVVDQYGREVNSFGSFIVPLGLSLAAEQEQHDQGNGNKVSVHKIPLEPKDGSPGGPSLYIMPGEHHHRNLPEDVLGISTCPGQATFPNGKAHANGYECVTKHLSWGTDLRKQKNIVENLFLHTLAYHFFLHRRKKRGTEGEPLCVARPDSVWLAPDGHGVYYVVEWVEAVSRHRIKAEEGHKAEDMYRKFEVCVEIMHKDAGLAFGDAIIDNVGLSRNKDAEHSLTPLLYNFAHAAAYIKQPFEILAGKPKRWPRANGYGYGSHDKRYRHPQQFMLPSCSITTGTLVSGKPVEGEYQKPQQQPPAFIGLHADLYTFSASIVDKLVLAYTSQLWLAPICGYDLLAEAERLGKVAVLTGRENYDSPLKPFEWCTDQSRCQAAATSMHKLCDSEPLKLYVREKQKSANGEIVLGGLPVELENQPNARKVPTCYRGYTEKQIETLFKLRSDPEYYSWMGVILRGFKYSGAVMTTKGPHPYQTLTTESRDEEVAIQDQALGAPAQAQQHAQGQLRAAAAPQEGQLLRAGPEKMKDIAGLRIQKAHDDGNQWDTFGYGNFFIFIHSFVYLSVKYSATTLQQHGLYEAS